MLPPNNKWYTFTVKFTVERAKLKKNKSTPVKKIKKLHNTYHKIHSEKENYSQNLKINLKQVNSVRNSSSIVVAFDLIYELIIKKKNKRKLYIM
jgi:hypothetical protein